ncbi:GtrA family protein [Streptomyces chiangmaiensis]|uniref:GtrA family protein n=1 Tax=Streptomyces chiangmaiensis TaxID=766497 RepID=A0ABU7FQD3_9ACTN|nr:GtrA family protein [Streptomyces chiangmaiensis]MED7826325.1 GtrA family protein [Streptomyces chiangmaiensis]
MPVGAAEAGVARQLPLFAIIGLMSTAAYLGLYAALRPVLDAQPANLMALLATAVANTAANRRFTFRVHRADGAVRHQLQGLVAFFAGVTLSSGALTLVHRTLPDTPHLVEIGALIVANAAATVLRFLLLRMWVFREP